MHNLLYTLLDNYRAIYEDKEVVVDGNMVSEEVYCIYQCTTTLFMMLTMVVTYDII